jgi:phosphonate transport system substrate-binding protein
MEILQYITKTKRSLFTFLLAAGLTFAYGCSGESSYKNVDFSKTINVERPRSLSADQNLLRVAVGAMISPQKTYDYYREILDYIGNKVGRNVQLVQRKTYIEVNELLAKGLIDIAFICSGPYATGKEKYRFEGLATPQVRGKPFYQSYLIVNKGSSYQTFEDLKGRVFAFTDPNSNSGTLVPKYWLALIGAHPESYFKSTNYTYSHDNSILAVAKSLVDGATVDGHIWEYYNVYNSIHTAKTRIIKKSEPFGSPPLVASESLPAQLKNRIRDALLSMHQDAEGKQILKELLIDRFVAPKKSWYDPIRNMKLTIQSDHRTYSEAHKS